MAPGAMAEQVAAVWQMALGREDWDERLDVSTDGVFRSFFAMIPVLFAIASVTIILGPTVSALMSEQYDSLNMFRVKATTAAAVNCAGLVVEWLISLALIISAAIRCGVRRQAAVLIAGYNWLQIITRGLALAPLLFLVASGDVELFGVALIASVVLTIGLLWGFLRRGLVDVPWPVIMGLMVALLATGLFTELFQSAIMQMFAIEAPVES